MILVIDNYDSFTHNLVQYIGELGYEPRLLRNDELSLSEAKQLAPAGIVIASGSQSPGDAGLCLDVIEQWGNTLPIFGVSLGLHCIVHFFGGRRKPAPQLMHGKTSEVFHHGTSLYAGIPSPFLATRYHSHIIDPQSLPSSLEVTAHTEDGTIMGVRHTALNVEGVQFHPESILTEYGKTLMANFLRRTQASKSDHVSGGVH